jgi:hypothetical protein
MEEQLEQELKDNPREIISMFNFLLYKSLDKYEITRPCNGNVISNNCN